MKILFLVKFYEPFDRGGSEWSTHDLAKLMVKSGHKVTILTPNYGTASHEVIEGIEIQRFPFIKLRNPKGPIAPFWTNNLIWFIYTTFLCIFHSFKKDIDIIHAHSNEFIPAAALASDVLKKPSVVTFRDYQSLCSLGFCLWKKNRACNLIEFITSDFPFFYQNYVSGKNPFIYLVLLTAAIRARLMQKIIYFFAQKIDYKIAVSQRVAQIFKTNGVKEIVKIHNPVIINTKISEKSTNEIIYIGKFSKGKGIDMLFEKIKSILDENPKSYFKIIGSGHLEKSLKNKVIKLHLAKKVIFCGQISHNQVLSEVKKAGIVVVPSIWPEPLPRSAVETLLSGTPVIATDVGGLKEVVRNNLYGILCKPKPSDLQQAITKGFRIKNTLKKNIVKDLAKLRKHFTEDVSRSYEKIYQQAHS